MMKTIGDLAFVASALMLGSFSLLFLFSVKWWTDPLGRIIAGVLTVILLIMSLAVLILTGVPLPGKQWWRIFLYGSLALLMFAANIAFIWAQFFAPRRGNQLSTRKKEGTS
jgi:hypothetical protein